MSRVTWIVCWMFIMESERTIDKFRLLSRNGSMPGCRILF